MLNTFSANLLCHEVEQMELDEVKQMELDDVEQMKLDIFRVCEDGAYDTIALVYQQIAAISITVCQHVEIARLDKNADGVYHCS